MSLDSRSREYREYVEAYLKDFYAQFHDRPRKTFTRRLNTVCWQGASACGRFLPLSSAACAAGTGRTPLPSPPLWR